MKKIVSIILAGIFILSLIAGCSQQNSATNENASTSPKPLNYPAKEIKISVPFAAGGAADLMIRSVEPYLREKLGQAVIIENKPGGSGAISMNDVIKSKPDGYTFGVTTTGPATITPQLNNVGYTNKDFAAVSQIVNIPLVLAVPNNSPYKSAKEFFDAAKANPNKIKVGTPGATTIQQIALQLISKEFGIQFSLVPFNGGAESVNTLLGGNLDAIFNVESEVVSHVKSGKFKALAISTKERSKFLPDVPTFKEQGMDIVKGSSYGLMAPKDTPKEIIEKIDGLIKEALKDQKVIDRLKNINLEPAYADNTEYKKSIDTTYEEYGAVLKK